MPSSALSTLAVTPTIDNSSSSTSLSLNKPKLDNLTNEVWKSAERLRGKFKAYEYQNVILPIIVIRRLECVLIQWREAKMTEIRTKRPNMPDKELTKLVKELELNLQQSPFSNKTDWTLRKEQEVFSIKEILNQQISTLTAYRKSLIHECVTGQQRVTEADVRHVEVRKAAAPSWTPRHEETSANEASQ